MIHAGTIKETPSQTTTVVVAETVECEAVEHPEEKSKISIDGIEDEDENGMLHTMSLKRFHLKCLQNIGAPCCHPERSRRICFLRLAQG
jgi:hypothetical protein